MIFFKNKKVGLVLGGGGARGFFHLGLIKGIQELGIEISEISGTSIGAVVGLMFATNPKNDFEKVAKEMDFFDLSRTMVLGMGLKNKKNIEKFLGKYIEVNNFENLKIKTRINATDINNREEVIFDKGEIYPAVIASISIPGVFPPFEYQNKFLIDGGMSNNIPITLIEKSDRIIVSDISGPIKKIDTKSAGTEVLYSAFAMMQQNLSWEKSKQLKGKEIVKIVLEDEKTFILDFRKKNYQYLFDLGYKSIMEKKDKLWQ